MSDLPVRQQLHQLESDVASLAKQIDAKRQEIAQIDQRRRAIQAEIEQARILENEARMLGIRRVELEIEIAKFEKDRINFEMQLRSIK